MTNYINRSLTQDETIKSTHKPSKWILANPVTFIVCGLFIFLMSTMGIFTSTFMVIFLFYLGPAWFLVGLIRLLFVSITLFTTEYGITSNKIIAKSGLIARRVDELKINKFEGSDVIQSILGRIFGFGDVVFSGSGSQKVKFLFVPNPVEVKRTLS